MGYTSFLKQVLYMYLFYMPRKTLVWSKVENTCLEQGRKHQFGKRWKTLLMKYLQTTCIIPVSKSCA